MSRIVLFIRRQQLHTILGLVSAWGLLAVLNYLLRSASLPTGTPIWFPISVFYGPTIHIHGIPYIALFVAILVIALGRIDRLRIFHVWLIGLALIILGNLGQGSFNAAFISPFHESGKQYFHDATKIVSWVEWLKMFNVNQASLLVHSRTHPPFAVLIHYLFLQIFGRSTASLSLAFTLISSLATPVVWYFFQAIEIPVERRNTLAILFSVIPAVNIYSAVSLDGIILTATLLCMLGLLLIIQGSGNMAQGILLCVFGFVSTNLLTYGGIFLLLVIGLVALWEILTQRALRGTLIGFSCLLSFGLVAINLENAFGYNHIQGFFTASMLENPSGFRGFAEPLAYLMTRIEAVCEIALFFSFGCLAVIIKRGVHGNRLSAFRDAGKAISAAGLVALGAIFLTGAYPTGETARACLFIYPYLMIILSRVDHTSLKDLVILASVQTAAMQLLGGYFW